MDTPSSPTMISGDVRADESKAQEQARLRRERRNAKIMAGGSDRLNKITSLSGRPAPIDPVVTPERHGQDLLPEQPSSIRPNRNRVDDPEEVDISRIFQKPRDDPTVQNPDEMLRRMLAGVGPSLPGSPLPEPRGGISADPLQQMMQQLLGGGGAGDASGDGVVGELPPGLASMFGGQQQPEQNTRQNYIWRIVHAIFALSLGLYAAFSLTFTGSEFGRIKVTGHVVAPKIFWTFATAELLLQSSRYSIDGGKLPASGIMGGLGQMLPQPYGGYVRLFSRYSIIYTTIVSDAMVVIFILGMVAWWKGLATA